MSVQTWIIIGIAGVATLLAANSLRQQLRDIADAVADWAAAAIERVTLTVEGASRGCQRASARARNELGGGAWVGWSLVAVLVAATGGLTFVWGEYALVKATATALLAPQVPDLEGTLTPPDPAQVDLANAIARVLVGGTVVLGGLPYLLVGRDTKRKGPLDDQRQGVKVVVLGGVVVLGVIAVVCSLLLGIYRADATLSDSATRIERVTAYGVGAGTATTVSLGSLVVGWALDMALIGLWLTLTAVLAVVLRLLALATGVVSDGMRRIADFLVPAVLDGLAILSRTIWQLPRGLPPWRQAMRPQRVSERRPTIVDTSPPDGNPAPGTEIGGRWQLISTLPDHDPMSAGRQIWLCRDVTGERPGDHVIKLLPRLDEQSSEQQSWVKEIRAAARVDNVHAVPIRDYGSEGRWLWAVTERYVPGSLAKFGDGRERTLTWSLHLMQQVLRGIVAIHEQNVMHLDLKPANVLLRWIDERRDELSAAVTDFGLSKVLDDDQTNPSKPTQPAHGSFYYAAREQFLLQGRTFASDLYSAGSILYWLLSDQPALYREAQDQGQDYAMLLRDRIEPQRLDEIVPDLPYYVADLAARWLSHDPGLRVLPESGSGPVPASQMAQVALKELVEVTQRSSDEGYGAIPVGPVGLVGQYQGGHGR